MLELINAELDVHEERLKYYRVQAHLAKARILDRSLAALDNPVDSVLDNGSANDVATKVPTLNGPPSKEDSGNAP